MGKVLKKSVSINIAFFSVAITVIPETVFKGWYLFEKLSEEFNVVFNRLLFFIFSFLIIFVGCYIVMKSVKSKNIKGTDFEIKVCYADLFSIKNCVKVIPFDECFTTQVGTGPKQIKPDSVCGQYIKNILVKEYENECNNESSPKSLSKYLNVLIAKAGIVASEKSGYKNFDSYKPGNVIKNGDYFLTSFAKLNSKGFGEMTKREYIDFLMQMWEEIGNQNCNTDVCVPVIGKGSTKLADGYLTKQEAVDLMISTYKLSSKRINSTKKIIIACKRSKNFALYDIGKYV